MKYEMIGNVVREIACTSGFSSGAVSWVLKVRYTLESY